MIRVYLFILLAILVTIISIVTFVHLFDTPLEFIREFKNGLLGAFVVVMATAIIFYFQVLLEGNREKQNLIYSKKIDFFQKVANVINKINTSQVIKPIDYLELKALKNETILIGGNRSLEVFDEMLEILVNKEQKNIQVSADIESAFEKLFSEFRLELLEESGKSFKEQKIIKNYLTELGNVAEIEDRQEKEKEKVFRTLSDKFNIIENFVNINPENSKDLINLEKKHSINNVKGRVKLFRDQLIKSDIYKNKLISIGIGVKKDDPIKIGSNFIIKK
jgi:hypothetical protein